MQSRALALVLVGLSATLAYSASAHPPGGPPGAGRTTPTTSTAPPTGNTTSTTPSSTTTSTRGTDTAPPGSQRGTGPSGTTTSTGTGISQATRDAELAKLGVEFTAFKRSVIDAAEAKRLAAGADPSSMEKLRSRVNLAQSSYDIAKAEKERANLPEERERLDQLQKEAERDLIQARDKLDAAATAEKQINAELRNQIAAKERELEARVAALMPVVDDNAQMRDLIDNADLNAPRK